MKTTEGTVQISIKEFDRLRAKDLEIGELAEFMREEVEKQKSTNQMVQIDGTGYMESFTYINIYPESAKIEKMDREIIRIKEDRDEWRKRAKDRKWYQFWK